MGSFLIKSIIQIYRMLCARMISATPALVRNVASLRPATSAIIARSFQTSTPQRDIDSAAKFIGAGAATVGYARNPSLKQQLFSYAILGFALSEAMGLFCLMV